MARAWPALAAALGDALAARFDEFERTDDAPRTGDPLRDGLAFAGWLRRGGGQQCEDVRVEVLLARAALARGSVFVGVARLRRPHPRLLVVTRLPRGGVQRRSLRLR